MASAGEHVIEINTRARWRAVSSPLRMRMIMCLEDQRVWTVRELADALGRSPQALYPHLNTLRVHGIVVDVAPRPAAAESAAGIRLAGVVVPVGFRQGEPFEADYARAVQRLFLEAARISARVVPPAETTLTQTSQAWRLRLSPDDAARFNDATQRYLRTIGRLLKRSRGAAGPDTEEAHVLLSVAVAGGDAAPDEAPAPAALKARSKRRARPARGR